ncbi:LCP family protein [Streptomyces tagetis]|uniref:LytR C-terminal domain-containing protein n=1 Tax=Streptomyces tagetis TaxID=2820809 RepID=A0A941B3W1_9ACTN|nr:LCP family protein [Streptomyces sp. RG38]MBQ0830755.1 LytR C-terminal domain-containing protein [Streptomyces sp. RG38]
MNDRYDAGYGPEPYELVGYDDYGRPVYRQAQPPADPAQQQTYDPYAQHEGHSQGYAYDPYGTGTDRQQPAQTYDAYGNPTGYDPGYGTYDTPGTPRGQQTYDTRPPGVSGRQTYDTHTPGTPGGPQTYDTPSPAPPDGRQTYDTHAESAPGRGTTRSRVAEQTAHIPQQAGPPEETAAPADDTDGEAAPDYRTEQFAFVEEPTDDSEDVIDWLTFTENRTERREEARRRARTRLIALTVVLALLAVGGVGYLWYAGKLPGMSSSDGANGATTATGAQKREVIAVHLHDTKKGTTSTVLLVDNTTTKRGTSVLLPNALALSAEDGSTTTLAKSVDDAGPDTTRSALDSVLGTDIEGTWRLDTPYLQILVDLVGNIEIDTDTDVPDPDAEDKGEAPLVRKGEGQTLSGKMAVAYATHTAPGETADTQLQRFGQVVQATLRKLSSDPKAATLTVQTLGMILDPPLTESDLGSFLAGLADRAKDGDFSTVLLPVQAGGRLGAEDADGIVKDILGGTAKSPDKDAAVSVSVRDATGEDRASKARVTLLNGGFTYLDGGTAAGTASTSEVLYADAADKENAVEVAKTLGLPDSAVIQGKVAANAGVSVLLGRDYTPQS